jgi:diguanylate cyclase (GGDEF)-like protein/PAS domain S-box-containing protein
LGPDLATRAPYLGHLHALLFEYQRAPQVTLNQPHWSILFSIGAACAGTGWGLLGLLSPVYLNLPYQAFVAFVVGGMAIGGIAVNASLMPAFLAFLLPTVIPLDLWFFWQGTPPYIAMGMLGLVFIAALYQLGRNLNESILRSIQLSIEHRWLANTIRSIHRSVIQRQPHEADEMKAPQPSADPSRRHEQLSDLLFPNRAVRREGLRHAHSELTGNIHTCAPAEVSTANAQEHAESVLHSMACAVVTTDIRGRINYMNPAAEVMSGWPEHEARNRPIAAAFTMVCEHTGKPVPTATTLGSQTEPVINLPQYSLLISKNGQETGVQIATAPLRSATGETIGSVLVLNDVTEMSHARHQLLHQATHDALTGLVNRREFERQLTNAVSSAQSYGTEHVLCYIDLDHFKIVNDTVGHGAGDELLKQITALLMGKIRMRDTLARIGGDEFALLLEGCPLNKAFEITQALVSTVRAFRFCCDNHTFKVGISIGVVAVTPDKQQITELLSHGDSACYAAKRLGGNQTYLYHPPTYKAMT